MLSMVADNNGRSHAAKWSRGAGQFQRTLRTEASGSALGEPEIHPALAEVFDSAARLQQLVPDAVLVGGSAAAYYARHRLSYGRDRVLSSLRDRLELVFDALDREGDFVLARAVSDKIILGVLGGIEVGVRQFIRKRPLEVQQIRLPSGNQLTVPTEAEILRIKWYRIVKRDQV